MAAVERSSCQNYGRGKQNLIAATVAITIFPLIQSTIQDATKVSTLSGPVVQSVRTPPYRGGGRGFKSPSDHLYR